MSDSIDERLGTLQEAKLTTVRARYYVSHTKQAAAGNEYSKHTSWPH